VESQRKKLKIIRNREDGSSASKRFTDTKDTVPILTLTTPHQISILGEKDQLRNKTTNSFRMSSGFRDRVLESIQHIPQWNYTSRPGESNSFLSSTNSTSILPTPTLTATATATSSIIIGPPVDTTSRTICTLQDNNCTIKIWNLDDPICELDDGEVPATTTTTPATKDTTTKIIETITLESPVVSMERIPLTSTNLQLTSEEGETLSGGVSGILANGQAFVALFTSSNVDKKSSVKVGIFDKPDSYHESSSYNGKKKRSTRSTTKARRRGTNQQKKTDETMSGETYLHCSVVFKPPTDTTTTDTLEQKSTSFTSSSNDRKKRTHSTMMITNNGENSWGSVEIYTFSINSQRGSEDDDAIIFRKFNVSSIKSNDSDNKDSIDDDGDDNTYHNQQSLHLSGTSDVKEVSFQLPHMKKYRKVNGENGHKNGANSNDRNKNQVKITALNEYRFAVVYPRNDSPVWNCLVVHQQTLWNKDYLNRSLTRSFPLLSHVTGRTNSNDERCHIVDVGSITTSTMAVLTSDDVIRVYDPDRPVLLHEIDIQQEILSQESMSDIDDIQRKTKKGTFSMATDNQEGSICVISKGGIEEGVATQGKGIISLYFAKAGMFDQAANGNGHILRRGQPKPSLASLIVSSMSTSLSVGHDLLSQELFPVERILEPDLLDVEKSKDDANLLQKEQVEKRLPDDVIRIEKFRDGGISSKNNGAHQDTFHETFIEVAKVHSLYKERKRIVTSKLLRNENVNETDEHQGENGEKDDSKQDEAESEQVHTTNDANGSCHPKDESNITFIIQETPQAIVDTAISVAIDVILSDKIDTPEQQNATKVLIECIKAGRVSGRKHLDKSAIRHHYYTNQIFRPILYAVKKISDNTPNIQEEGMACLPLCLICHLLKYSNDSIPEHMLVSMLHFILCYTSEDDMTQYWAQLSKNTLSWHKDHDAHLVEKRIKQAMQDAVMKEDTEEGYKEELINLHVSLKRKLFIARKIVFAERIVSYSKCNPGLLRNALKGTLVSTPGSKEIEVVMKVLTKLLKKAGKETNRVSEFQQGVSQINRTGCITEWLSAMTDVYLETFQRDVKSTDNAAYVEVVKNGVEDTIKQCDTMLQVEGLVSELQKLLKPVSSQQAWKIKMQKAKYMVSGADVPLYSLESITF